MLSRRVFAGTCAVLLMAPLALSSAQAFEFHSYEPNAVKAAIASGKSIVVHVYAPWCLQCRAQASILARLADDPQLDRVTFFKVDYDNQKDIVAALDCPRSTLIGYKGGKEVARMSWGTSQEDVTKVLQAAY
jgi:thioredoxin 1